MTHLSKTQEGSQFYRFHDNSEIAEKVFTSKVPMINEKKVEVLQVLYVDSSKYNVMIEFIYKGDK